MAEQNVQGRSREEQVGFHKGSLSTLAKEREELLRILSIVEQLMQMHVGALKDMGIDLAASAKQAMDAASSKSSSSSSGFVSTGSVSSVQATSSSTSETPDIADKLKEWKL